MMVGVSAWSMFQRGQCFGSASVQVRLIFEVPQGLSLAGTLKVAGYRNPYAFQYVSTWSVFWRSQCTSEVDI